MSDDEKKPIEPKADDAAPAKTVDVPAVHTDELWGGPRWIENAQRESVFVRTKREYWDLLAKNNKRMVDQQESDPDPHHYDPPPPPIPIELTPPPPPKPMTQEEAHVWAAMGAVYRRYSLEECLWCKQCAMRYPDQSGIAVAVTNRRVRYECRCGSTEYLAPKGTTDLLSTFADTAITALDRTSAKLETPIGGILVPAHLLQDREAQLIRRYARSLLARDIEPWIFCKPCRSTRIAVLEDDTCAVNITSDQIAIVCPKHCRMLFYQGATKGSTVH